MKKIAILIMAAILIFAGLTFLKYEKRLVGSEAMIGQSDYQKAVAGIETIEKSSYGWFLRQTKIPLIYPSQYGRLLAIKGVGLYEIGEINKAKRAFFEIKADEQLRDDKNLQVFARYNLGKILSEDQDFINSEWEYIETLKIDPSHYKAKVNLEILALMKKEAGMDKDKQGEEQRELHLKDLILDPWSKDKNEDGAKKDIPRW